MPVEHAGWMRRSRFLGAMRYHRAWMGRLIGWGLLVLLAGNAIAIAAALAGAGDLNMAGVSSDFSLTMALLLVCACLAAHSRTRFLLRFGTARFPVWLSNVLALFLGAAAFLLGTLLINLATGGTVLLLSRTMPARFTLTAYTDALPTGAALLGHTLRESLEGLPQQLLWLLEWTSLFYLLPQAQARSDAGGGARRALRVRHAHAHAFCPRDSRYPGKRYGNGDHGHGP